MNIYVRITEQFNEGKLRAVICSGQAVVLHHLAIMSKDGDWIVREDEESMHYILGILSGENEKRLATYMKAAEKLSAIWPDVEKELPKDSLFKDHQMITRRAENILPFDILQWS